MGFSLWTCCRFFLCLTFCLSALSETRERALSQLVSDEVARRNVRRKKPISVTKKLSSIGMCMLYAWLFVHKVPIPSTEKQMSVTIVDPKINTLDGSRAHYIIESKVQWKPF